MERQHSIQVRTLSLVSCILLLAVLVLANVVFARTNLRLDLTEEQMYTLDDGSRAVLAQLQDPCTVQVFWHGVPTVHESTRRYVSALLEEMAAASQGNFQVTWVDMSGEAGRKLATDLEVPEYVFPAIEGDEYRASRGHMSLVISMGDQPPTVLDRLAEMRDQLEYRIVADVQSRTRLTPPVIALVTDLSGDPEFQTLGQALRSSLGSGVRTGLTLDEPVPQDVQVLILAAPKDLSALAVYHFEQYLFGGGRAIVLLDPVDVMVAQGQAPYRDSGMRDWFERLGVHLDGGVVEDFERPGRLITEEGVLPYPAWPIAVPVEESQNILARSLRPVVLRWAGGFRVDADQQKEAGRTVSTLLTSSEQAYRRPDVIGLMRGVGSPIGKTLETIPLAVLIEGPATSFWKDKALPKAEAAPADDGAHDDGWQLPEDLRPPPAPPGDADGSPDGEHPDAPDVPKAPDAPDTPEGDAMGSPDGDEVPAEAPADEPADEPGGERGPAGPEEDAPAPPAPAAPAADAPADAAAAAEEREGHLDDGPLRLVVLGDADLVRDFWMPTERASRAIQILSSLNGGAQGGFSFVLNASDWMTGSEQLLTLRARSDKPRTLQKLEASDRHFVEWLNILALPLLMLLIGIVVWIVRGTH
jgi:ABC-type uncharacterized transport system involved in gliding motility auxiliary subunit